MGENTKARDSIRRARRFVLRLTSLVVLVLVVAGSVSPGSSPPMVAVDRLGIPDEILHFFPYCLLALLPSLHESRRVAIGAGLAALVIGAALELAQTAIADREFGVTDLAANTAGVICGFVPPLYLRRP